MDTIYALSQRIIDETSTNFFRYLFEKINWDNRLIAITGSRGTGKTTLLKQYAKTNHDYKKGKALYVSLDHIWFSKHTLFDLADMFVKDGGEMLLLDEVHKYETWSREIKNIYDYFPSLKVAFTGSSLLKIEKGEADLSRRVASYHLHGMSLREFAKYDKGIDLPRITVDEIIQNHIEIATEITRKIRPLPLMREYLQYGYYPYYKEDIELYHERLLSTINTILEVDLPAIENIERVTIHRMKKLLSVLSEIVPCTPNTSKLSQYIESTRPQLLKYLTFLGDAKLIMLLEKEANGLKKMEKPQKLYLGNPNYSYAFGRAKTDIGSVRETFFMNQVGATHSVLYSPQTDFMVDNRYSFEIGGKNKTTGQIRHQPDSFVAADDIEIGHGRTIPLWLFGLTY